MSGKIKIGILVNGEKIPNWVSCVIEEIKNISEVEFSLIIERDSTKIWKDNIVINNVLKYQVFRLFQKIERIFINVGNDALKLVKLKSVLPETPILKVNPVLGKFTDCIVKEDIDTIKEYDLDLLLRFGFRILKGDILSGARMGVWSYHHGDNRVNRGGPAGFWEVFLKTPTIGYTIQKLTSELDAGLVLHRAELATDIVSFLRNRNALYWKSTFGLPHLIRKRIELGEMGFNKFVEAKNSMVENYYSKPLFKMPSVWIVLKQIVKFLNFIFQSSIRHFLYTDYWVLIFKVKKSKGALEFFRFQELTPPKGYFWADPFTASKNDSNFIFFEEFDKKKNKGYICCAEMNNSLELINKSTILEENFHLSFPFLFQFRGRYYMIPESAQSNHVMLYECMDFPYHWKKKSVIFDNVDAVDSIVFFYENKWWLFTTQRHHKGYSNFSDLYIYYSDNPVSGNWSPHRLNPVLSHPSKSRSAGAMVHTEKGLFRPVQDCTFSYGRKIIWQRINKLSETEYDFEEVGEIDSSFHSKYRKIHTINDSHILTVADALKREFIFNER